MGKVQGIAGKVPGIPREFPVLQKYGKFKELGILEICPTASSTMTASVATKTGGGTTTGFATTTSHGDERHDERHDGVERLDGEQIDG